MRRTKRNVARKSKRHTTPITGTPTETTPPSRESASGATESCCHGREPVEDIPERSETAEHPPIADAIPNTGDAGATHLGSRNSQQDANGAPGFVPQSSHQPLVTNHGDGDPRAERNCQNAQRSTGPRTAEGKAASSRNATKHGLSIQRHIVLQHEDPAEFDQLRAELHEIFAPASPRESLAIEEIAECRRALRRFDEAETALLNYHTANTFPPDLQEDKINSNAVALGCWCVLGHREPAPLQVPSLELLHRYRRPWDRRHNTALTEFDRAQRARRQDAREQRQQAEAIRKAEAHEANERRKQELHELKLRILAQKLEQQMRRTAKASRPQDEDDFTALMDQFLAAPPPYPTDIDPGTLASFRQQPGPPSL